MKPLETNDFMVLNHIIYKIYTTADEKMMQREFLEEMKLVLDFDSAEFYLAAEEEKTLSLAVAYNSSDQRQVLKEEQEYREGLFHGKKSLVYRETDRISDTIRLEKEYYKKIYVPNSWHYSLQMILCVEGEFLGLVIFYRTIGKEDYQYEDIFILDFLKEHMAFRLQKEKQKRAMLEEKMTVAAAAKEFSLTKRETTILKLLVEGLDNEQISKRLVISVNTLKKHILNIYRKLHLKNRVQLFKMIRENDTIIF